MITNGNSYAASFNTTELKDAVNAIERDRLADGAQEYDRFSNGFYGVSKQFSEIKAHS